MANDYLGFAKEATFGTKPGAPVEWCNILSETMRGERTFEKETGVFYNTPRDVISGSFSTSGSIRFQLGPDNGVGRILNSLLRAPTTGAVIDISAFPHTFDDANPVSAPQSMTLAISRAYALGQFDYLGQVCSRFSLEAVPNQSVRAEAEWVGDFENIAASADTPSIPATSAFISHESEWRIGATPGTEETKVEGWTLEIARAVELVHSISSLRGSRVYGGPFTISGRADIDFDTLLYYKRVYGADTATSPADRVTVRNVEINLIHPDLAGATTEKYSLKFRFPKIVFETAEANQTGRDRITGGFPWVAYYDSTAGFGVKAVLTNKTTTY